MKWHYKVSIDCDEWVFSLTHATSSMFHTVFISEQIFFQICVDFSLCLYKISCVWKTWNFSSIDDLFVIFNIAISKLSRKLRQSLKLSNQRQTTKLNKRSQLFHFHFDLKILEIKRDKETTRNISLTQSLSTTTTNNIIKTRK